MKRLTLLIAALLLALTATAQNISYDDDFTQTREMKVPGKTIVKSGHMTFDGVDHLSMEYTEPEGEYFIINGITVKINMGGKKNEINANKVKSVGLQRTTLLNCLAGNWKEAAKANNAETVVNEDNRGVRIVTLTVKGKVPRGGYSLMELTYRTSDGKLQKMVLVESTGIRNTYTLSAN
ncbi:MAG: outer membrane lipoprotein carrier protein LolA [Bacteroidales bacterium]|nr:outer membrane lipoprotein carrier protein LolA [Bacteroidales bacterium]